MWILQKIVTKKIYSKYNYFHVNKFLIKIHNNESFLTFLHSTMIKPNDLTGKVFCFIP